MFFFLFVLLLKCFEICGGIMLSLSCVSACEFCFVFGFLIIFLLCGEVFWEMMPKIQTEAPALLNYYYLFARQSDPKTFMAYN